MADDAKSSTVPRRTLGRHLQALREGSGLNNKKAAERLEISPTTIWRIETGQNSMRSRTVREMCELYGAPEDLKEALMALATQTKSKGWLHSYGDVIPDWFDLFIGLEASAETLSEYASELIPGLLQTPAVARSLITFGLPDVDHAEIERRVDLRISRQSLLLRETNAPVVHMAINEAVLRRPVGSPDVMAEQLRHLVEVQDLDNLSIRVVPFSAGLHSGALSSPFVLMTFPGNGTARPSPSDEPPTVYVEGLTGALYLDKPGETDQYALAFDSIWRSALTEADSTALLKKAATEMST